MPPLGHARPADRPCVPQHHHARGVAVEAGIVDACGEVVDVLEHERPALVLQQRWIGGTDLHDGAVGTEAAVEDHERATPVERVRGGSDHVRVHDLGACDVLAERPPAHGDGIRVEEVGDLRHHRRQPSCVVEVLHQVAAAGFRSTSQGVVAHSSSNSWSGRSTPTRPA